MNPKRKPKAKPKRKPIPITIPINEFIKKEINSLTSLTDAKPKISETKFKGNVTEITITLEEHDYASNIFHICEKISLIPQVAIREYRYSLIPYTDGDTQYFRFDFQPKKIPARFPDSHINVDENTFGKHHLVYPGDTCLDLHKLTIQKAVNVFFNYEYTHIHPALDLGKTYISIVNGG